MDFIAWLVAVLGLFSDILNTLITVDIFCFFLAWLLFVSVVSFVALLVRSGRKGKL
mgnify:CR=1 FL=1